MSQLIGYARVSTTGQDLQPQLDALDALGVDPRRVYVDQGLTGKNRDRPSLREALAACHEGSTLVVTKLDRLGRSLTDLRNISDELIEKGAALNIGGALHDPLTPMGRLLFNAIGMVAEFEGDLISQRTKEGMAVAKRRGRLKGKQPKLSLKQARAIMRRYDAEDESVGDIAASFNVSRATIYRTLARAREASK